MTEDVNPDGTTEQYTYNSFAEPLTSTDEYQRCYPHTPTMAMATTP